MNLSKESQLGRYGSSGKSSKKKQKKRQSIKKVPDAEYSPECEFQQDAEQYLEDNGFERWIHVPDIVGQLCRPHDRRTTDFQKRQLSFYFKDVADLVIFGNAGRYPAVLALELKTGRNMPSADQREYLKYMYGDDWERFVVRSMSEFVKEVDQFKAYCKTAREVWSKGGNT